MQTQLLKVTGMTCGGCISKVTNALKTVSGVSDVNVSLSAGAGYGVDVTNAAHSHQSKGGCCG